MKKTKKPLTVKQKQQRYRRLQYTCVGGELVSVLTPFITLGALNYDKWFMTVDGWKVGIGGGLALALMGIAVLLFTKKKEDKSITNGWITLIIGWFAVAFIFVLLNSIIHEIATIMLWGGLGLIGAFGLDLESQNLKKKADTLKEVLKDVEKDTFKEEAKRELEKELKKNENKEEDDGTSI